MTPIAQWQSRLCRIATAGLALLLLAALFLPAQEKGSHGLTVDWRPSVALAGLLFLLALVAVVRPRGLTDRVPALLCAVVTAAAGLLNFADAITPSLLGRDLNLYWDAGHLPSLVGLAADAAGSWRALAASAAAAAALAVIVGLAYWSWRRLLAALADRRIAVSVAVVSGLALNASAWLPEGEQPLAAGLAHAAIRQAAAYERGRRAEAVLPAALAVPGPPQSDLARLRGQDVYLVFIESYGTVVFDRPAFRAALAGPMAQFDAAVTAAGYSVASNRLVSPTYGGGSWLAHATLASGVRLDDPVLYAALFRSGRKLLPAYFKQAGWRAIDIMPGIKGNYPEGAGLGVRPRVLRGRSRLRRPGLRLVPDPGPVHDGAGGRDPLGPRRGAAGLHPDRAGVEPYPVPAVAALSCRLERCRDLRRRAARCLARDLPPARLDASRPGLCQKPRIRFRRIAGLAGRAAARECARHAPGRPPAAGHGRGRSATLDRADPRAVARSSAGVALSRPGLCRRPRPDTGRAASRHGEAFSAASSPPSTAAADFAGRA